MFGETRAEIIKGGGPCCPRKYIISAVLGCKMWFMESTEEHRVINHDVLVIQVSEEQGTSDYSQT